MYYKPQDICFLWSINPTLTDETTNNEHNQEIIKIDSGGGGSIPTFMNWPLLLNSFMNNNFLKVNQHMAYSIILIYPWLCILILNLFVTMYQTEINWIPIDQFTNVVKFMDVSSLWTW